MSRFLAAAVFLGVMVWSAYAQDVSAPNSPAAAPPAAMPEAAAQTPAPDQTVSSSSSTAEPTPEPKPQTPQSRISVEIDLQQQRAYLLKDGRKIAESPISSGRAGHLTPTGDFSVTQKDPNHFSSLYGSIVDKSGRTVVAGADAAMAVPRGCHFKPAPMKNFMRFEGAAGMHAGLLPGYPASHGCVRMPAEKAKLFYRTVEIGSPVHVFGKTPSRVVSPRSSTVRLAKAEREGHTNPPVHPAPLPPQSSSPAEQSTRRGSWFPFFHR